jgi:hypothetical protein
MADLGTGALGAMVDDLALGALGALAVAGVLALEVRGAGEMLGTVGVGLALVAAALEGSTPVAREAGACRHALYHLALGVDATGVWILARRLCRTWLTLDFPGDFWASRGIFGDVGVAFFTTRLAYKVVMPPIMC